MLRPLQAEALWTLVCDGCLFAPIGVGEGKTLITALAPVVMESARPVLLVPAALREKTEFDFSALSVDWPVPEIEILSYETLARADHERDLFELAPDLVMCDEAHKVRNPNASVTRRVGRYVREKRPTVVLLSGTLQRAQIASTWHLLQWTHGPERAPIPATLRETEHWGRAIDDGGSMQTSLAPGALAPLGETQPELQAGYGAHVRGSLGVVGSSLASVASSLRVVVEQPPLPRVLREAIETMRATRCRPDGIDLEDAQLAAVEMQLSLGFWYGWAKSPPAAWARARRAWFRLVREVLDQHLEGLDSPEQVMRAYGKTTAEGLEWRAVQRSFTAEQQTNWITYDALYALVGSCTEPTLIWTDLTAAGEAMEKRLGIPFFHDEQRTDGGAALRDAGLATLALSIKSCREGVNLQQWSQNLVLTPPASAEFWEQMLGRTHRSLQKADEVVARVYAPTAVARGRIIAARAEARAEQLATNQPRKLAFADLV